MNKLNDNEIVNRYDKHNNNGVHENIHANTHAVLARGCQKILSKNKSLS